MDSPLSRKVFKGLCYLAVGAIPFAFFVSAILSYFYHRGAYFLDAGLQAGLIWHSDPALPSPGAYNDGLSFWATHASPFFLLLNALSWLLPLTAVQFFAVILAAAHAVPGLVVFSLLTEGTGIPRKRMLAAALIALAFSVNGLSLVILRYPHLEIFLVGFALLFFVALFRERYVQAAIWFGLCLSTREDAGFHLFALLVTFWIVEAYLGRYGRRSAVLAFGLSALAYSIAVLTLQKLVFPHHDSSFVRVYVGSPPFAGLTVLTVLTRILAYVVYRAYVIWPAFCAIFGSIALKNVYPAIGYIAFLPWLGLHLLAASAFAGTLSGYYAFPFLIAMVWPLYAIGLDPSLQRRQMAILFGLMLALSWILPPTHYQLGNMVFLDSFRPPSLQEQRAVEQGLQELSDCRPALGHFRVDDPVLALAPRLFRVDDEIRQNASPPIDTLVYLDASIDDVAVHLVIKDNDLAGHYMLSGTSLRIATSQPLPARCGGWIRSPTPPIAVRPMR